MASASRVKEVSFAGVITLLSAALLHRSYFYPAESSQFPRFMMLLQSIFSVVLLAGALRLPKPAASAGASHGRTGASGVAAAWRGLKTPLQVFVGASAYVMAIGVLGYFASTALYLGLSMFLFGRHKPLVIAGVALGFIAVIYGLFVMFIGVRLPQGLLF